MAAYYNENDPDAADWLCRLMERGVIAPGHVDRRSIEEVTPDELRHFTQCHFFAGIGVWSYALRQAGWPDDRPVWTGSCPCQPFSASGKRTGFADERHLWPAWHWLVEQCRPATVFGEQVAGKDAEPWVDLIQSDLEALDYAFGCVPFPAAGVGAPNLRDRLFWVADTEGVGRGVQHTADQRPADAPRDAPTDPGDRPADGPGPGTGPAQQDGAVNGFWRNADWLLCRDGQWRPVEPGAFPLVDGPSGGVGRVLSRSIRANRLVRLKGYGNAINAEAARIFIESAMLDGP